MMKSKRSCTDSRELASVTKKRRKLSLSEDDSSASCSKMSESLPLSKIYNSSCGSNKPAELFRKDLISAMKLPDSEQLDENNFWYVTDSWKQEWERGVQVPVNSKNVPLPKLRELKRKTHQSSFKLPKKLLALSETEVYSTETHVLVTAPQDAEKACRYDLDDTDFHWLTVLNENRSEWGHSTLNEENFELIIEAFEVQCFNKFQEALKTQEGLGIEYDDDVICDVCRSPECEEGNEMVFCDICNICVHQACYGITAIPEGSWVCRTCAVNVQPSCVLCPNKGGAMKSTKQGDTWAHVSCALWIPEVVIVDPEKMEPISKISQIPPSRWALICTFCRERVGACIQCCVKQCKVAYHVTCAFDNGLEINAVYNETKEDDGVKLRSFCSKHGFQNREGSQDPEGTVWKLKSVKKETKAAKVTDLEKHNARLQKIREMEAEFYRYVSPKNVKVAHTDQDLLDLVYYYWKIKRTANYNKPLLTTKMDETALLGKQPEDSLYSRMKMFVHLRQDLERVRNLCYMVGRREKHRRSFIKAQEEVFRKQLEAIQDCVDRNRLCEKQEILTSSLGETIYDKIYFAANYKPTEIPAAKEKEADEKKKLMSASRLPNPYAKLYFNGIHTRSRGHSTTSDSGCIKEVAEQTTENADVHLSENADQEKERKSADVVEENAFEELKCKLAANIRSKSSDESPIKTDGAKIKHVRKNSDLKALEESKFFEGFLPEDAKAAADSKPEDSKQKTSEDIKTRSMSKSSMEGKSKSDEDSLSVDHIVTKAKALRESCSVSTTDVKSKADEEAESGDSMNQMSNSYSARKCRRLSVPSPVIVRVEPKSRKRRSSAHYLEISKNQVSRTEQVIQESDAVDDDVFQKGHLTMELRGHGVGKENVPAICDDAKKSDVLMDAVSLCDVKNSPSQSDKENAGAKPNGRGKRVKSQSDAKASEAIKLGKESLVVNSEMQENFKNIAVADAIKFSNVRSSRYEMRTRNSSGSNSHDDSPLKTPEKSLPVIEDTAIDDFGCESDEVVVMEEDDDISITKKEELIPQKRTRLKSRKKRTRRRLFSKVSRDEDHADSIRTINLDSSDSSTAEDFPDAQDSTRHLPHIEQEYKMTLRQNGKVVLSPLRKRTTSPNNKPPSEASSSSKSPKDIIARNLKRAHNSSKDTQLHQSCPSQHASLPHKVSSPRIVLKLVKDRTRHSWQKRSSSPETHSTFKVVRNDWEMTSDSKDSVISSEFDDSLIAFEDEPIGHRYLMRSRSKLSS